MKILVTGINGAVGGNLFRLFGKDGSFILDGMSRQPYHLLELNPDINTYNIDLIKNSPEPSFFDKYDVIFHTAAVTPKFAKSKIEFSQNDAIAQSIAKSLIRYKGRVFLFSTGSVYRPSADMLNENSELNFEDPYGASMLRVEEAFSNSIKDLTIFRLFYPYGFDQYTPAENLIAKLLARINGGQDISVNPNYNSVLINPLFIADLYFILCKFLKDRIPSDIYNVAGPDALAFSELIKMLYQKAKVSFKDSLINDTLTSPICGNTDKLFQHIDRTKLTSLEWGINQIKLNV